MRKLALSVLFFSLALPAWATTYYLAPAAGGGSDSNNGTSMTTPWLTPNHAMNCGDVILAAASTAYAEANFRTNQWGTITCPAGNNVAWLKCVTFDACKITISIPNAHDALTPTQSYWGVQGWEVTATADGNACFEAFPPNSSTTIHHIIFANDIANGCYLGGFTIGQSGSAGVDYVVVIGSISYNAAQTSQNCNSGIDIVTPTNSDTLAGTHYYIGGNFSWGNVNPNPCGGGTPSDGQGIFLDTVSPYSGQIVIDNNISVFNGGMGIKSYLNASGSPNAPVYIRHNTTYGNQTGNIATTICSEIAFQSSLSSNAYSNLAVTGAATGCAAKQNIYALAVSSPDPTAKLYNNFLYSAAGNYTTGSGAGFGFGPNVTGTNPGFVNAAWQGAPNCANFASVPACMATMIANFTPTNPAAAPYGYLIPSSPQIYDPLFPQWLCSVTNLPAGLLTMGCLGQASLPASPTITGIKVQ
jgi:hypothetical protein